MWSLNIFYLRTCLAASNPPTTYLPICLSVLGSLLDTYFESVYYCWVKKKELQIKSYFWIKLHQSEYKYVPSAFFFLATSSFSTNLLILCW